MKRFERLYEEHESAVRAYVRRRAPERQLQGIAVDDVASVAFVDADGNVPRQHGRDEQPVRVLHSIGLGAAAYVEGLDADGNVVSKQPLPPASSLTPAS